ncbi:MAG: aminotransferase class V-fold PLP-dependent enzyme [Saprospiraceae bacterium]|nr:aminotransferase class V-fold PLP-dependent enzyme [Saprospiraceae bacterium]
MSVRSVEDNIRDNTFLISIMLANNEIGVINDIQSICDVCRDKGILIHTDATQIIGKNDIDLKKMSVDFFTFSGHKIYAPKGIGILYVKDINIIRPIVYGGGQENGLRSGTLNVPNIIGLAESCKIYMSEHLVESEKLRHYKDIFENFLLGFSDKITVNGDSAYRLPNISNISFPVKDGYNLMNILKENEYVACSSGSACDTSENKPSHVLKALGKTRHEAKNTLRFSFGRFTTEEEIIAGASHIIEILRKII